MDACYQRISFIGTPKFSGDAKETTATILVIRDVHCTLYTVHIHPEPLSWRLLGRIRIRKRTPIRICIPGLYYSVLLILKSWREKIEQITPPRTNITAQNDRVKVRKQRLLKQLLMLLLSQVPNIFCSLQLRNS